MTTSSDFHAALYQTLTHAFHCGRTPTLVKLGPDAWRALIVHCTVALELPKFCSLSRMQTPGIAVFTQPFTLPPTI